MLLSFIVFTQIALADEPFATRKQEKLNFIDKNISAMQEHRTCVNAAQNHEDLNKCREKMKSFHREMKEHRKEMHDKK